MRQESQNGGSSAKKTDEHLLAGAIPLKPEAQAILTRQVNRRIIVGYKVTKLVFQCLACSPLLISAYFVYVAIIAGPFTLASLIPAALFIGLPALVAFGLFHLARKI